MSTRKSGMLVGFMWILFVSSVMRPCMTAEEVSDSMFCHNQSDGSMAIGRDGDKVTWRSLVGKKIVAQGIASVEPKGLLFGYSRVIIDDTSIEIEVDPSFGRQSIGRLVEVTGVLSRATKSESPPRIDKTGVQLIAGKITFFYISDVKWKFIDRADMPFIRQYK